MRGKDFICDLWQGHITQDRGDEGLDEKGQVRINILSLSDTRI